MQEANEMGVTLLFTIEATNLQWKIRLEDS